MKLKIIAEFCQNHNGDYSILKEMMHEAADSGATYGKIQTIFAEDLTFRERFEHGKKDADKIISIKRPYQIEYERLKKLELSYDEHRMFIDDCKKLGLIPLTTAFSRRSVDELTKLDMDTIKVASYDCASIPLIEDLAKKLSHLIISTGATYQSEIEKTAKLLVNKKVNFSFLHCTTIYPTPLERVNLAKMSTLKKYTKKVGFSDHTHVESDGIVASIVAIHLGAEFIERHFTILKPNQTKDGPVSINPNHVRQMVEFSKLSKFDQTNYLNEKYPNWRNILGESTGDLSDEEKLNRDYYRGRFGSHDYERNITYNWEVN